MDNLKRSFNNDMEHQKDPGSLGPHGKDGPTIYYDGSCPLCYREIKFYRNMAGADNIAWYDVASSPASYPTIGLAREVALKRFHVKTAEGTLLSGAAGFAHLWLNLPRWRLLGVITSHRIVLPFAEVAYRLFLLVRPAAQALARKIDHGQISPSK